MKKTIRRILPMLLAIAVICSIPSVNASALSASGHYFYTQRGWDLGDKVESQMCYSTCYAMVISNAGRETTPPQIYEINGNKAYVSSHKNIADNYGFTSSQIDLWSLSANEKKEKVRSLLSENPWGVIVGGLYGYNDEGDAKFHYVVAIREENGEILFDDPVKGEGLPINRVYEVRWSNVYSVRTITPGWHTYDENGYCRLHGDEFEITPSIQNICADYVVSVSGAAAHIRPYETAETVQLTGGSDAVIPAGTMLQTDGKVTNSNGEVYVHARAYVDLETFAVSSTSGYVRADVLTFNPHLGASHEESRPWYKSVWNWIKGLVTPTTVQAAEYHTPDLTPYAYPPAFTSAFADEHVSVSGATAPETLTIGDKFTLKGTIKSDADIVCVTAEVVDAYDNVVLSASENTNNVRSFDLNKKIDRGVKFNDITEPGSYRYVVTVRTASGHSHVVLAAEFREVANTPAEPIPQPAPQATQPAPQATQPAPQATQPAPQATQPAPQPTQPAPQPTQPAPAPAPAPVNNDTISAYYCNLPDTIPRGAPYTIGGRIFSAESDLRSVTVGIYDGAGNMRSGKTCYPNAKMFEVYTADTSLLFNEIDEGSYRYKIIAENASGTSTVIDHEFTVIPVGDTISINSYNYPKNLAVGKPYTLKGKVTSASSKLNSVSAFVYDLSGNQVTGRSENPNAKTYSIKNLDRYVYFNYLAAGEYRYVVTASNDTETRTLVDFYFTVS